MDEAKVDLVKKWLTKALHDILSARILSDRIDPILDTAIFHCQQAAEKSLKGFLVYHDLEFEKTHNIVSIIELAAPVQSELLKWLEAGEKLTMYAVTSRYPDEELSPSEAEFNEALQTASDIYEFVLSQLPVLTHPSE